jgi:hypothetical protein
VQSICVVASDLQRPIDPRHHRTRRQGGKELTYVPWSTLVRCLLHRAEGYSWEIRSVQTIGDFVAVTGRLTIPTADGPLVYENVSSESLSGASFAPPVETAASSCLRRCCAMAGLGLELWEMDA